MASIKILDTLRAALRGDREHVFANLTLQTRLAVGVKDRELQGWVAGLDLEGALSSRLILVGFPPNTRTPRAASINGLGEQFAWFAIHEITDILD